MTFSATEKHFARLDESKGLLILCGACRTEVSLAYIAEWDEPSGRVARIPLLDTAWHLTVKNKQGRNNDTIVWRMSRRGTEEKLFLNRRPAARNASHFWKMSEGEATQLRSAIEPGQMWSPPLRVVPRIWFQSKRPMCMQCYSCFSLQFLVMNRLSLGAQDDLPPQVLCWDTTGKEVTWRPPGGEDYNDGAANYQQAMNRMPPTIAVIRLDDNFIRHALPKSYSYSGKLLLRKLAGASSE